MKSMNEAMYLEATFSADGRMERELDTRIGIAMNTFEALN